MLGEVLGDRLASTTATRIAEQHHCGQDQRTADHDLFVVHDVSIVCTKVCAMQETTRFKQH